MMALGLVGISQQLGNKMYKTTNNIVMAGLGNLRDGFQLLIGEKDPLFPDFERLR